MVDEASGGHDGVIQGMLIVMVMILAAHDGLTGLPLAHVEGTPTAMLVGVAPFVLIAIVVHVIHVLCGKLIDRGGAERALMIADWSLTISRLLIVGCTAIAVMGFGWLDWVRTQLGGDLVLVDEALTLLPALLAIAAGWWSHYLIDRRLREAALLGLLDGHGTVVTMPTRWQYLSEQVRHHMLLVLIPVTALTAWSEVLERLRPMIVRTLPWSLNDDQQMLVISGLQLVGVGVLLMLMPIGLRMVWRTVPLGPGPLRDRLVELCKRQGVRVRGFYVWRTHQGMINGALVGIMPWARYILLTEALLEQLPGDEVEAVMAHEVAHARRHHLPWLLGVLIGSLGISWWIVAWPVLWVTRAAGVAITTESSPWLEAITLLGSLAITLVVFSWVSRKFERQADAFGAQHLSGLTRGRDSTGQATIQVEAAGSMIRALGAVSRLNRVPIKKFSWRHGSIADRQRQLRDTVGRKVFPLPIDRQVRWIKLGTLVVVLVLGTLTVLGVA